LRRCYKIFIFVPKDLALITIYRANIWRSIVWQISWLHDPWWHIASSVRFTKWYILHLLTTISYFLIYGLFTLHALVIYTKLHYNDIQVSCHRILFKDARSVSLYPYNWSQILQYVKDARSAFFRSELFTSYILTIFKQRKLLP